MNIPIVKSRVLRMSMGFGNYPRRAVIIKPTSNNYPVSLLRILTLFIKIIITLYLRLEVFQ